MFDSPHTVVRSFPTRRSSDLEKIRRLPFDESSFRDEVGAPSLGGEEGRSTLERIWTRPTCEINGLLSGYTGEGDRKSTRLNSSHLVISYAVFCLKKKRPHVKK